MSIEKAFVVLVVASGGEDVEVDDLLDVVLHVTDELEWHIDRLGEEPAQSRLGTR